MNIKETVDSMNRTQSCFKLEVYLVVSQGWVYLEIMEELYANVL